MSEEYEFVWSYEGAKYTSFYGVMSKPSINVCKELSGREV